PYLRAIGRWRGTTALQPRRILILTNVFQSGDPGDYGRMMRDFAHGLLARGHEVRVAAAGGEPAEGRSDEDRAWEARMARSLELFGQWKTGCRPTLHAQGEVAARNHRNLKRWRAELNEFRPDLILAGNLDLLGPNLVQAALNNGFPVLHMLANAAPGYPTAMQPCSARYWIAPCSDWNGLALRQGGYSPARIETVYPGARTDRFFRFILPDNTSLRICYSGLMLPGQGAHVLVQALKDLRNLGVDFRAEIAGEAPDPEYLEQLQEVVRQSGLGDKIRFSANPERDAAAALYARSNVFVFPSQCPEPFGISQVEAMASGLVVVTSGTGGAKEVVRHGTDGLHFAAESAEDLADKLRSLAQDGAAMTRLQRAAQARATEFSVDRACERIEEVMEAMLMLALTETSEGIPLAAFEDAG
ncbi:MAG: glycosyltransferase family 4 protein, partial [Opitutaceae bacterium]